MSFAVYVQVMVYGCYSADCDSNWLLPYRGFNFLHPHSVTILILICVELIPSTLTTPMISYVFMFLITQLKLSLHERGISLIRLVAENTRSWVFADHFEIIFWLGIPLLVHYFYSEPLLLLLIENTSPNITTSASQVSSIWRCRRIGRRRTTC